MAVIQASLSVMRALVQLVFVSESNLNGVPSLLSSFALNLIPGTSLGVQQSSRTSVPAGTNYRKFNVAGDF